jgi:2-hydroxy-6-oxonona-2,4-dienedioate hydrolase
MTQAAERPSQRTASAALRNRTIVVNGVRTHYTEAGDDGPVLIALHGGGAGSSGGAGMGGLLPELAPHYRAIAIDSVGGFGQTDPSAPTPYGVQSRVEQVEAVVDAMGLDRFVIVGNSQGAWVAAKYAIQHPDRVTKMVLIASATISAAMGIPEEFTPAFKKLAGYNYTREAMRDMMEALIYDKNKVTDELIEARYLSSIRPGAKEALAAFSAGHRYLQSPEMFANFDMRTSLPEITKHIPTEFVWGEQDAMAPAHVGRQLEALLPGVKFRYLDHAGHQVQTDQPHALAQIIVNLRSKTEAAVR